MQGKTNAGSGALVYCLGTGTSFNVSHIPGYTNLVLLILCKEYLHLYASRMTDM